jgi:hypothetical protein
MYVCWPNRSPAFARRPAFLDKAVYSAFADPRLAPGLGRKGIGTLIVTGGETDACVLSSVMAPIDLGFRVLLPAGALCSARENEALGSANRCRPDPATHHPISRFCGSCAAQLRTKPVKKRTNRRSSPQGCGPA